MKLENQVCSLELAKKIKQLGVKQDSLWWWMKYQRMPDSSIFWTIQREEIKDTNEYSFIKRDNISAFTVAELGEMLPFGVDSGKTDYDLGKEKSFFCAWREDAYHEEKPDKIIFADTEANARAKMLIWLIEQGKVEP